MVVEKDKQAAGEKQGRKPWTLREFGGKTFWDWLQLLIVPVVLSLITVVFAWQQDNRQNQIEKKRTQQAQKIENQRAEAERELAVERAQDEALQAYVTQMGSLLLEKDLRESKEDSEVRTLAQARTSTVIQRLDADRNRTIIRFLTEAGLTGNGQSSISILAGADLQGANLEGVDLSTIDLSSTILDDARLADANLTNTDLNKANLKDADLSDADLCGAEMSGADLSYATLKGDCLNSANLDGANLSGADLSGAKLDDANLREANLSDANLSTAELHWTDLKGANLTNANLNKADLWHATLNNAYLSGADLSGADLSDTTLDNAYLSGADLRGASLEQTELNDADPNGIFQDNFSDKSNGWDPNAEYAHGGLRLSNTLPGSVISTTNDATGRAIKDAVVEVKATVTGEVPKSEDSNWGIVCRAADDGDTAYELGISSDGHSFIWRFKDDKWTVLDTERPSEAVRGGNATNYLRAECWGSSLTLFVNGRRVNHVEDSKIKSGSIGFYVDNASGRAVDILFEELRVTGPPWRGTPEYY